MTARHKLTRKEQTFLRECTNGVDTESYTFHRDGTFTIRQGYFYKPAGLTGLSLAQRFCQQFSCFSIVDHGDNYNQWPKDSYVWAKLELPFGKHDSFLRLLENRYTNLGWVFDMTVKHPNDLTPIAEDAEVAEEAEELTNPEVETADADADYRIILCYQNVSHPGAEVTNIYAPTKKAAHRKARKFLRSLNYTAKDCTKVTDNPTTETWTHKFDPTN